MRSSRMSTAGATDLVEHPQYGKLLDHDSYDRMFVVTLGVGEATAATTIELGYGD